MPSPRVIFRSRFLRRNRVISDIVDSGELNRKCWSFVGTLTNSSPSWNICRARHKRTDALQRPVRQRGGLHTCVTHATIGRHVSRSGFGRCVEQEHSEPGALSLLSFLFVQWDMAWLSKRVIVGLALLERGFCLDRFQKSTNVVVGVRFFLLSYR